MIQILRMSIRFRLGIFIRSYAPLGVVAALLAGGPAAAPAQQLTISQNNPCSFGSFQTGPVEIPLQASGGTGSGYTWSISAGSLPTGLAVRNDGVPPYFPPGTTAGIEGVATTTVTNQNFTLQVTDSGSNTATAACTMNIISLAITDPGQFADGLVGSAYSYTPNAAHASGSVTWSLPPNNNLPPGLSLDGPTGRISGTPTQPGNFGFSLSATDNSGTTSRFYNIQIYGVGISGAADLGNFQPGQVVNIQLAAAGGTPPYNFNGGGFPPGISMNQSGLISGTVTGGGGTFRLNLGISDHAGNNYGKMFVMNVIGVPTLPAVNVPNPIEDATIGETRNFPLNVNGGQSPYTWSISAGTIPPGMELLTANVPSNLNLGPYDAVITGAPTATGTYTFTVSLRDSSPTPFTVAIPVTINVTGLTINYPAGNPTSGTAFSYYIEPIGGTYPYTAPSASWTILDGSLPPGLSLNAATGVISGTPTSDSNSNVFMQISAGGITIHRYLNFNVRTPSSISFNNGSLPDGVLNGNYNYNLNACCALNGLNFTAVGSLPPGLNLNSNGQLFGMPTQAGAYTVTIQATDNNNSNNYAVGIFNLNISQLQVTFPPPNATVGANYAQSFAASGGTGPYTWTVTSGSQLPPGVSLSPSGAFSGSPNSAGSFHINFMVADTTNPTHNVLNGGFDINVYPAGTAPPPNINFGNNFGTWTVGEVNFALNASGGNGTYTWNIVNGSLPTGVTIRTDPPFPNNFNGAQAGLSGVATVPNTYNFTIAVTSGGQTSYQYCTWKISAFDVMDGGGLPPAFVGVPYSYTFTALNASGSVTWTQNNGTLPPGLTFSGGTLSGTPSAAGNYNFGYLMNDGVDQIGRGTGINVYAVYFNNTPGQNGFQANAILSNVPANSAVNATFQASGGSGGYTYSANGLPCCLQLSPAGVLSGTLSGFGNFGFQVTVTDSSNNSYGQQFSIDAIGDPPQLPAINLGPLAQDPVSSVGQYMSWAVSVNNGGTAPFTWTVTGLPPGVSYRPYEQSELSYMFPGQIEIWGTATAPGSYPVTYKVTDANGLSATATSTLTVSPVMVDFSNYPQNGTVGVAYSDQIRGLGGTPPYTIAQLYPTYNPLPDGLTLNTANFTIGGTPLENGGFNPMFKITDAAQHSFVMLTNINVGTSTNPPIGIGGNSFLGNVSVNSFFQYQFNACCTNQYTYSVGSGLPPGIGLSASGQLSGTATTAGNYTFLVKAADANNPGNAGYRLFNILVTPITLTASTNLPFGNVGTLYNYQIPVGGNSGAVTFQAGPGSVFPPGVTLSGSGVLNGTPTATGQFQFNALISDTGGNSFVAYFNLSIYGAGSGPAVVINTGANLGTVPIGMVQIPLNAAGGTGSFTWSVTGGSLPPGLSLRTDLPGFFPPGASAGIIGVATAASTTPYSFTLTVSSGTQSASQAFQLKITGLTTMENFGFRLPDAFLGSPYSYTLTPLNNAGSVTFSNPMQVPPGMTLSSSGVLSGVPTANPVQGDFYNIGFTISDGVDTVALSVGLSVNVIQITSPPVLPNATQNQPYSHDFTHEVSGGSGSYTFNINGYPNGLTVNNGVLSGTVNSGPFRYNVNVTATDSQNNSYTKTLALVVVGVPPALPSINPYGNLDDCSYGIACSRALAALNGGVPPFTWTVTGLPNGMQYRTGIGMSPNITATDVELWGTPLQTGVFNVAAVVTDSSSPALSATQTFPFQVSQLWPDNSGGLGNGQLGMPYSATVRILGGTPAAGKPLYNAQVPALQLPEGLTLNGMTVSGTPQVNGNFSPDFTFTDHAGTPNTLHVTYGFNIGDSGINTVNLNTFSFADGGQSNNNVIGYYAQGQNVNFQINACCSPQGFNFLVTGGNPPSGVTLSPGGQLNGTIALANPVGAYTFTVQATDAANSSNTGLQQYTIYVSSFNVSSPPVNLPYGVLHAAYDQQIQASNSVTALYTLVPGYYLPPGLFLSPSGKLSGTPSATGQYLFFIAAANSNNGSDVFIAQYNLSIWTTYPPLFLGTGPTLGPLSPGVQDFQLTGSGGVPPYHYSFTPGANIPDNYRVQDGGQLPEFFQLNQGTGGLIGVVHATGAVQTSLRVTDSATPTPNVFDRPVTMNFTDITTTNASNPPAAYVGVAYSYTFAATGGASPYAFSISGLPAGLNLTGSTISGTPSSAGSFQLNVNVKDSNGTAVNFGYNLTVFPFNIATGQVLTQGNAGQAYSQQLSAPGCSGCAWSIVDGNLPGGLSLNSATGVISGTPNGLNNNVFTVQAASSGGATAQKAFAIYVQPNTPQPLYINNNPNLYTSGYGTGYWMALFAQGGAPPYTWSVSAGSLPAGMSLMSPGETLGFEFNPGFTYLIGRPLTSGPANFTLQVTDSAHNTATQAFTWNITPLNLDTNNLPANANPSSYGGTPNPMAVPTYGVAYSQQIEVSGGTGTYTSWTAPLATNPLPAGLSIDQTTGVVSGTPGETGSYSTLLQATDSAGNMLEQFVNFNIVAGSSSTVNIGPGPNLGVFQTGFTATINLNPNGGTGPYAFTVLDALPPGCSLESGNQLLTGGNGNYELICAPLTSGAYTFTLKVTDSAANYGVKVMNMTFSPVSLFTTTGLANGSAGTGYSQTLLTWDNGGTVSWSLAPGSALPPNMTLNGATIGGTPLTAGNYSFTLNATDSTTGDVTSYNFNISVSTITITDPSVIQVHASYLAPYSYQFTATGGGAVKTWSANNLPPGLSMGSTTGTVSGTAQGSGSYNVAVTVTDGSSTLTRNFTIFVDYPQLLTISPSGTALADARLNQSYSVTLQPSGGLGPYTWALAQGSSLPDGLQLYSGSALPPNLKPGVTILAGAPTSAKQYTFDLVVTDSSHPANSVQATYTLNVTPMAIETGGLPNGTISSPYSRQLTAVGGTAPYTYTVTPAVVYPPTLPPGITVSPSGLISGTPTSTGQYSFRVTAADSASHSYTTTYTLTVTNSNGMFISGAPPYTWHAGGGADGQLSTNQNSTYTWTVQSGTLPSGLSLSTSGQITGAPGLPGVYNITVRATDNNNSANFADRQYALNVSPMQLNYQAAAPPSGMVGSAYSYQYAVTGGTPPYTFATTPLQPLPPGLSISSTGLISGTPTQGGSFTIWALVTDSAGNTAWAIDSGFNMLNPGQNPPLLSLAVHTHNGSVGVPFAASSASYSYPLDGSFAIFGVPPISYAVAPGSSLPPGMELIGGANGVQPYLGGIPTTPGQYNYTLTATDSVNQTATVQVYTVVSPLGLLPAAAPNGVVGTPYSVQLSAFGGAPPYTYGAGQTTDGSGNFAYSDIPPGLSINAQGLVTGTPTMPGTFNVVNFAQDSAGKVVLANSTVVIDRAGSAQGIGISPINPIELNYVLTAPPPASVPVNVTTTSGSLAYDAMVSGIPGASLSATSGNAPANLSLSLDTTSLAAGTYAGVVGIYAPNSVNNVTGIPVALTVTAPPPCVYTLIPTGNSIPAAGGSGSFTVSTGSLCSWTATTTNNFVTIIPASASGTGTGTVQYSLTANTGLSSRTGSISVNGQTYSVTQFGSNCALALNPPSVTATAAGGLATVNVTTTNSACSWTASGLSASPTSGTGSGTVTFTIPANQNANTQTLNATVQLNGGAASTFTVTETGLSCTVGLSASGAEIGYSGGSGQVNVTTPNGCAYSTVNGPSWISVTSPVGGAGTGSGPLTYSVAPNSTTASRSGTLAIGGVPYTISQDPTPCSVTVDTSQSGSPFDSGGGGGTLVVTANGANCSWTASSPVNWITLAVAGGGSGTSVNGSGNANITVSASSNALSTSSRSASLTVAGQSVGVTQGGTVCSFVLGSTAASVPYVGGSGSVTVTAPAACTWSSSTDANAPWLTISSSGSGGTSNVVFSAAPNGTSSPQTGTLTIAGQPFTVTEAAGPCSYILNNTSTTLPAAGGSGLFTFSTATTGCTTQAISFANWLTPTISSSPDGTSGTVNFTAGPNPSGMTRTGTIQFAGQTYTVLETGAACAYSLNAYGLSLGQAGGSSSVDGSPSAQGCTPDVGTDQPNIVTLGTFGPVSDIFIQQFSVVPYSSTVTGIRTMIITFGGQLFTIKQTSW